MKKFKEMKKQYLKIAIDIFLVLFFLLLIVFIPRHVLADACSEAHAGWSCQDPAARDGLADGPCDTAVSCPTSGHKCCPPVATQRDALATYQEGRTKETAGDRAGACESYRRAQEMLPSRAIEQAITRVCEAAPAKAAPTKIKLEAPITETSVPKIIGNIIKTLLAIVGALSLGMFVYGGFTWLTSGGNPDRIKKGKDILFWAFIGLTVIFASYTLVDFLLRAFGL
jgi:hypothetical protein